MWVLAVHFLDPECYFGIEPNRNMLDAGRRVLLEPGLADLKKPTFDSNVDFDFSVFGESFDFLVARSIWTHASKTQIKTMLDGYMSCSNPESVFVASYVRSSLLKRDDYKGRRWVGVSHDSDSPGIIRHGLGWIRKECAARGLVADEIRGKELNFGGQTWLRIKRRAS